MLDGRDGEPAHIDLGADHSAVLLAIDKAQTEQGVARAVRRSRPGVDVSSALADLVEMGLAIRDGDGYVGLPVFDRASLPPEPDPDAPPTRLQLRLVPSP